ncbi:hypothetical protein [Clostridium tagluense]|uniref:hypothetical protein n=1 Tax=Clostridium tagluense TaxID=360422 RepID=UPI001C6E7A09|nr:hypothetical protein [Clostridium tagluense]MBW9159461.1 hypothetical protein [Clostridium tagluense]WLC68469.1 hypothetical protein KTC93_25485 [Clostridium tagluense]
MTKKEIVLANKYNKLVKYTNSVQDEVLITLRKLIRTLKDSDTEETKKINDIVGQFLTKTEIIATEYLFKVLNYINNIYCEFEFSNRCNGLHHHSD